jgi:hypothetical protein
MNLKFHSPVLITKHLEELKDFYINTLSIPVELDFGACVYLKCGISLWKLSENHKIAQHLGRQYSSDGNELPGSKRMSINKEFSFYRCKAVEY